MFRKGFYTLLKENSNSLCHGACLLWRGMVCGWGFVSLLQVLPFQTWCKKSWWRISLEWWQPTIIEALPVVSLHIDMGEVICIVEMRRSGINCTECDYELWSSVFPVSSSICSFLSLYPQPMGLSFLKQRKNSWISLHVFHLAVFSAEWCWEERGWVGIGGMLQGGVKGLYLLFSIWRAAPSLTAVHLYVRKILITLCISLWKFTFKMNKKILGSVADT